MPEAPSFPPAPLQPSRRQPAHWFPVSRHARKAPARAPRQADHALRPHPLPLAPAEHPQSGLFARPRPLFMAILAACLAMPASARTEEVSSQVPAAAATAGSSTRSRQAPVGTPLLLAQSSHAHGRATTLPAVTVHARKAEEKAKDLPFTVNVTDDVDLETRRITRMEDVLRGTPGVDVNSWGGPDSANVRIRGVGSLYLSGTDDNSVVVNVDGVPTSVSNIGLGTLDAEQIEVLKGPQGTLFGRSSTAGAIDVRSAPPVLNHFGGHVRGELGNDHHHLAEGVLNAPLGDTLAARIALRHSAQDLWYENSATGRPLSRPADLNARASLLWQPQAATQVLLRASRNTAKKYQSAMLARPYTSPPPRISTPTAALPATSAPSTSTPWKSGTTCPGHGSPRSRVAKTSTTTRPTSPAGASCVPGWGSTPCFPRTRATTARAGTRTCACPARKAATCSGWPA